MLSVGDNYMESIVTLSMLVIYQVCAIIVAMLNRVSWFTKDVNVGRLAVYCVRDAAFKYLMHNQTLNNMNRN